MTCMHMRADAVPTGKSTIAAVTVPYAQTVRRVNRKDRSDKRQQGM